MRNAGFDPFHSLTLQFLERELTIAPTAVLLRRQLHALPRWKSDSKRKMSAATVDASHLAASSESFPTSSPSCSGGVDHHHLAQVEQEALAEVDAILSQERWRWMQELVERLGDAKLRLDVKRLFFNLVKAETSDAVESVLGDLESWRAQLEGNHRRRLPRKLKEISRTLFLLGADKQFDLLRTTAATSGAHP